MGCQEVAHKVAVFPSLLGSPTFGSCWTKKKNRPLRSLKGSAKIIFASVTSGLAGAVPKNKKCERSSTCYPLVNVYITIWKITDLLLVNQRFFYGHMNSKLLNHQRVGSLNPRNKDCSSIWIVIPKGMEHENCLKHAKQGDLSKACAVLPSTIRIKQNIATGSNSAIQRTKHANCELNQTSART